ncbi:MAG TPA: hypothetical protein VMJ93_00480 [Verrucomicrobiae bacterium]|nr:hypothetical protein [Verrucomicrobiae bacterium]
MAATLGAVCHHHTDSSEANCPICHVTHQPAGQSPSAMRSPLFCTIGFQEAPPEPALAPAVHSPRLPARAPPSL